VLRSVRRRSVTFCYPRGDLLAHLRGPRSHVTTDPIALLTKQVPDIVNAAVSEIKALADGGDADAKQRHADLVRAPGAAHIVLEGAGGLDVYLVSEGAHLRADRTAPSVPVLLTVSLPAEAVEVALDELGGELANHIGQLRKRLVRLSPARTRAALDRLAQEQLKFHLVITDTPDFDEVRVKIATGSSEAPDKPAFTVGLDYATFEQLRARKIKPQALLSKLKLSGDSARAMQLGMELMQKRGA
jgi:putative sterol carrier protein